MDDLSVRSSVALSIRSGGAGQPITSDDAGEREVNQDGNEEQQLRRNTT